MDALLQLNTALAGRYALEREIGRGGMATVYLAQDLKHHRNVAVKVLKPELAAALGPDRFLREISIAAKLNHPHILPLLDSGETEGGLYYIMPYVEGESLRDRLLREKQLPVEDALRITREVVEALGYAHGHDVVHRDIKPENILLQAGQAVVADFGIARALTMAGGETVTEVGMILGTPDYMSPEQAEARGVVDGRSDIYSLGCVLYEALAGHPPFAGTTVREVLSRHTVDPVPSLRAARPDVSASLEAAVTKALAKVPAARFATAREFADALDRSAAERPAPGRRRLYASLAVVILLAGVVVGSRRFLARAMTLDDVPRVAVLPLQNLGVPGDEYLADGITDEITTRLSVVPGLAVISTASTMEYKQSKESLRKIGGDLGARYVLTGTIRWQPPGDGPGRVRVASQLIRVADDRLLWGDTYDESVAEVFTVQARIAERVVASLGVALGEPERRSLNAVPTHNLEAYDYLLRGMDYTRRGSQPADYRAAIEMYRRALELDPEFGGAYAELSMIQTVYWSYFEQTEEHLEEAKRAADRAVELHAAYAPLALGYYYYRGFHDYDKALEYFTAAERAQPSNGAVAYAMGAAYKWRGDWDKAIQYYRRSLELDPRARGTAYELGSTLTLLRRYSEAEQYFDLAIEIRPDNPTSYTRKAWLRLVWKGDRPGATTVLALGSQRAGVERVYADLLGPGFGPYGWWMSRILGAEPAYRVMMKGLSPGSAGIDSAAYYVNEAVLSDRPGDQSRARVYLDSARIRLERDVARTPGNARAHGLLGFAYAGLGRKDDAWREGRTAAGLVPVSRDAQSGSDYLINLGLIAAALGEPDSASAWFASALAVPSRISDRLLRLDPTLGLTSHPNR